MSEERYPVPPLKKLPQLPPGYYWNTDDGDINLCVCHEGEEEQHGYKRDRTVAFVNVHTRTNNAPPHDNLELLWEMSSFDPAMHRQDYPTTDDAVSALYAMCVLGTFTNRREEILTRYEVQSQSDQV